MPKGRKKTKEIAKPLETKEEVKVPISKPAPILKNGICVMCNDPVKQEPAVFDYPCHKDCHNSFGNNKVLNRINELRHG